jgi:hypothetical protein
MCRMTRSNQRVRRQGFDKVFFYFTWDQNRFHQSKIMLLLFLSEIEQFINNENDKID